MAPHRQEYQGHRIEFTGRDEEPVLLIDNVPVRYGRLPDGQYFLHGYAYDWSHDLVAVARRFIDYRRRVERIRAERASSRGVT